MSVPQSDAELARQALAGSDAATRELVARYATPAVNFAFRLVHDRGLAEDLAQEAFLRAFRRLNTYDPGRSFAAWFFQILRNLTIDHLRIGRLNTASLDELADAGFQPVSSGASSPEQALEQSEVAQALAAALDHLRPEYREVVVLRYQEGLTQAEIAETLGQPLGTVKTNLYRARKELAGLLKPFSSQPRNVKESGE